MKVLIFLLGRSRRICAAAILTGMLAGAGVTALLTLIHDLLARAGQPVPWRLGGAFVALCVLVPATRVFSQYLLARLGQDAVAHLRNDLSRKIVTTPLRALEELGPHRLLAALTGDVTAVTAALGVLPVLSVNGTVVVGSLGYLAYVSPPLFGVLALLMVLGILAYRVPQLAGMRIFQSVRERRDALFSHFRGLLEGIKELKLHNRRTLSFLGELRATVEQLKQGNVRAATVFTGAASTGQLLFFAVIGAVLLTANRFPAVDSTVVIGYTLVLLFMMNPLQLILDSMPQLAQAGVAIDKLERLGFRLRESEAEPLGHQDDPPAAWRRLELQGATFSYENSAARDHFDLGPLDLVLEPGDLVFVVGGNGSGKTTLGKLLTGLYPPTRGEIRLDGERIDGASRTRYRQLFAAVFSDFYLFDKLLGLEQEGLDARAETLLRDLRLGHKVEVRDGRLSTLDLSRGQRKRLALMTSYLEDRPIYLFDEWAADQDPVFKELFYRQLLPELKRRRKAVVVITHDERYFGVADRLLKLEDGRMIELRERPAEPAPAPVAGNPAPASGSGVAS